MKLGARFIGFASDGAEKGVKRPTFIWLIFLTVSSTSYNLRFKTVQNTWVSASHFWLMTAILAWVVKDILNFPVGKRALTPGRGWCFIQITLCLSFTFSLLWWEGLFFSDNKGMVRHILNVKICFHSMQTCAISYWPCVQYLATYKKYDQSIQNGRATWPQISTCSYVFIMDEHMSI